MPKMVKKILFSVADEPVMLSGRGQVFRRTISIQDLSARCQRESDDESPR